MKSRRLVDLMEMRLPGVDPNTGVVLDNMVDEWNGSKAASLSVVLVELRFLYMVHQTHHWVAKGDSYYGDHLLFQRLYEGIAGEIDQVAEKAVGLGDETNVNMVLQVSQLQKLSQGYGSSSTVPMANELAKRSLRLEKDFLLVMDQLASQMREQGVLTRGVDNLLAGIEDAHEGHVYLLKQRCGR